MRNAQARAHCSPCASQTATASAHSGIASPARPRLTSVQASSTRVRTTKPTVVVAARPVPKTSVGIGGGAGTGSSASAGGVLCGGSAPARTAAERVCTSDISAPAHIARVSAGSGRAPARSARSSQCRPSPQMPLATQWNHRVAASRSPACASPGVVRQKSSAARKSSWSRRSRSVTVTWSGPNQADSYPAASRAK